MNASPDIETRLRDHLAAEREAIKPPADLEARVLRRLQESDATRPGTGVARPLLLAAALVLFAAGLAFGVARLRAIPGPIRPNPTVTATVTPTASPIASARSATPSEYADMGAQIVEAMAQITPESQPRSREIERDRCRSDRGYRSDASHNEGRGPGRHRDRR